MNFDLYADEHEPKMYFLHKTYVLRPERPEGFRWNDVPIVHVTVDNFGCIDVDSRRTQWPHEPDSRSEFEIRREIYAWLVEWEFAEWKSIGPEDSELFITEKFEKLAEGVEV